MHYNVRRLFYYTYFSLLKCLSIEIYFSSHYFFLNIMIMPKIILFHKFSLHAFIEEKLWFKR